MQTDLAENYFSSTKSVIFLVLFSFFQTISFYLSEDFRLRFYILTQTQ